MDNTTFRNDGLPGGDMDMYIDDMYPDSYFILFPYVLDMATGIRERYGDLSRITPETIDGAVNEVIVNANAYVGTDDDEDAIPTISQQQWGRRPCWGHRCRRDLNDIARILLLRELFGHGRHNHYTRPRYY